MSIDPIVLSIPIFFLLIVVEVIWDATQRRKSGKARYRLNDAVANISCGILDQVSGVFAKVFTVGMYTLVWYWGQDIISLHIPSNIFMWALCFVAVDFAYYWSHRLSHEVNLFWTGHVVHHQSEEYNLSVALRQGAFQKLFMFWIYLPLALLGFPPEWFLLSMAFNLLYQFWIHTEMIGKMGFLELFMNTPSHHRVHHGRNPKYIDKNHAGVFIVWDKMFKTFQIEEEHPTYGITSPLNSFNPVEAHTMPFQLLWADVKSIPGLGDKLRYLIKPPGWYPASLGGFKSPPPVSGKEKKFNISLPIKLSYYILVQYLAVLGLTSLFLFNLQNMDVTQKVIFTLYIVFYVMSLGSLFNGRRFALALEIIRLVLTIALAVWLSDWFASFLLPVIGGFALLSLVWIFMLPTKPLKNEILY